MPALSPPSDGVLARAVSTASSTAAGFGSAQMSYGRVQSIIGLLVEASDVGAAVGELCYVYEGDSPSSRRVAAEVVGVRHSSTLLMPLDSTIGLKAGGLVERSSLPLTVPVGDALLGRVIDSNGHALDELPDPVCAQAASVQAEPPPPMTRKMIDTQLETGVRAIDAFVPLGRGQRIGIFAGSGVGKSTLLGMIARNTSADVNVIALIGERSREVQEFIVDSLGEEGLRRSVVVAATGDQAAMRRVKAASVACAIAEHYRDQGKDVLLMMDSVTRVAMAQREIGLAVGEPPTARGYTPSVFTLLPRLLERAGTGTTGSITGIFTVLVDGDDMNEPIGDATRGILDGHIVLSRALANSGHFPSIDVLQSVSRLTNRIRSKQQIDAATRVRGLMDAYRKAEDLIRIGAYVSGSDPEIDRAIAAHAKIERFLRQPVQDRGTETEFEQLIGELALLDDIASPELNVRRMR